MIVTALDANEVIHSQLWVLLRSLFINSLEDKVRVHMVGCTDKQADEVTKAHPEAEVFREPKPKVKDMRGYMVCYRAQAVLKAMLEQDGPVAWMDADVIVRGSLRSFWEKVEPNVLQIQCRNTNRERTQFQAGIFAVGNSSVTKNMIREWADNLAKLNQWYADQLWLYRMNKKHKQVKLVEMPLRYNNVGDSNKAEPFLDDSIIWHCKGSHFDHPTFQKEFVKYKESENES